MNILLIVYIITVIITLMTTFFFTWRDWSRGHDIVAQTLIAMVLMPFIPVFNLLMVWWSLDDIVVLQGRK